MSIKSRLSPYEFVALMALLSSLTALAIDAILPALSLIASDLSVVSSNDKQKMISYLFGGLVIGKFFYGPLSDSFGRKPMVYIGVFIFIIGTFFSLVATDYNTMLLGRFLQGIGAASTQIISMAMVRDQFSGEAMAKVMSLITMIFILVPALAPSLGQIILFIASWRAIFWMFLLLSSLSLVWFYRRQPETLTHAKKRIFSVQFIKEASIMTLTNKTAMGYTLTSGLIFGAFIGYLTSSQQIFVDMLGAGDAFPVYFGTLAISVGFSSFMNSKLVEKYGMRVLCYRALLYLIITTGLFLIYCHMINGVPTLIVFMLFMLSIFSGVGILFGNMNSLALEPMGKIAGMATALTSSLQNMISLGTGAYIGSQFNGTIYPLAIGFFVMAILAFITMLWTENFKFQLSLRFSNKQREQVE